MASIDVALAPPQIAELGRIAVTNSMISAITSTAILIIFALILRRKLALKPGRLQMLFEMGVGLIYGNLIKAFGDEKRARKLFPLIFTIFIFLLVANNFTWIPFIETIKTENGVSIFTTPSAHYSMTITLALIMIVGAHIIALIIAPISHIGNFIKIGPIIKAKSLKELPMAIIGFFLGLLDIVGEIAKVISISTRLFGNMFAGGVIILIISSLAFVTQFFVPLPFMLLGVISGFVQAFVFAMLGTLFMSGTINAAKPVPEKAED